MSDERNPREEETQTGRLEPPPAYEPPRDDERPAPGAQPDDEPFSDATAALPAAPAAAQEQPAATDDAPQPPPPRDDVPRRPAPSPEAETPPAAEAPPEPARPRARSRRPRRRRHSAAVYRRRRLAALAILLLIIIALALVIRACAGGSAAQPAPSPSPTPTPSPSPSITRNNPSGKPSDVLRLKLRDSIVSPNIAPKSVVSTGTGYVFAQNMMYRHTMTVYDASTLTLKKTIPDRVDLAKLGVQGGAVVRGAPVEAAESPDHKYMYVSQYSMYGKGFTREGSDVCSPNSGIDPSYVYRVALDSLTIDAAVKVGAVPKYLAVTPNGRYLLVTNWCSYSLSIIDTKTNRPVKEIPFGRAYPRGIAVDPQSKYAYVAIMGGSSIARVDLGNFAVKWMERIGAQPRHLVMSPDGRFLYVTLNGEGRIARVDLRNMAIKKVATGNQPRSMAMAPDGKSLYVVNYTANTVSKVRARDMREMQEINTNPSPIGVTYDAPTGAVWVCCYGGSIMVFDDVER